MDANFKLPPLMFTTDEAVALAIGLLAARHLSLADTAPAVESARAKLQEVMPADLTSRVQALTETITLDLKTTPVASVSAVMLTMSNAAQQRQRVHMRYRSSQGDETERDFDPYGLAYRQGQWYVVGFCHLRQGLRTFRLERVIYVAMTDTHFDRPANFDALMHIVQAIATLPRQFTFQVLLKTDLVTAQCEVMDALGLMEPHDAGVLLRGSVDDMDWLARQLATFPFDFVVLEPDQLRVALRKLAAELANLAGRS